MSRIAVIGAGLAGLTVARGLARRNEVTVFEKSRGVGGRIATRYAGDFEFDHGAQFFTARTTAFQSFLDPLLEHGVIANWPARFAELDRDTIASTRQWDDDYPHYVGVPRMNAIGKWLATGLDVRRRTRVVRLDGRAGRWCPVDETGAAHGPFDWVVVAVPARQATPLLPPSSIIHACSDAARMKGCYALMIGLGEPLPLRFDAALVRGADISWVSVNSSKPGRGDAGCLVVHSTNTWADEHIDDDDETVANHLLAECSHVLRFDAARAPLRLLHRWRYANCDRTDGPPYCIDTGMQLAACGDWFVRGRIEAAFTSANALLAALPDGL